MKKSIAALFLSIILTACTQDRSQILKVYNWSCYIDEPLIEEFEKWYNEQTGENVHVIYQTFDVNETMLAKIEVGHEDFDVVCPSEYIIERMLMNDLLLPLNQDFGDTPNYMVNISPFMKDLFDQLNGFGKNANDYSVGYMWGTTGLLYNPSFIPESEVHSWEVLRNPSYAGKVLMKDAFRDIYTSLLIALNKEKIESGEKDIRTITMDSSDESIKLVEDYLNSFKDGIMGYEADFGKEMMVNQRAWLSVNWSGDAEWAIKEAEKSGLTLAYTVPEQGSIVWFDGWVIPKYARNVKAANYFINFMCKPENAIRNMNEIGYVSAVGGNEILESKTMEGGSLVNASYFFGPEADSVIINPVQYPDESVMRYCGIMHDSGDRTPKLLEMWSNVKGDSATNWTYIFLISCVAIVVIGYCLHMIKSRNRRKSNKKSR